ncbi:MAG: ABC transporter ATP-binding protein [Spirochaetes bacterium]|nr:ABC transporter ATP-binding protein [Spirochaetota bacterium]
MECAVEVFNLRKQFGNFTAVNSISFSVKKGEIFGFLGPNGAGKTTTIKMLCGILTPTDGSGHVLGLDIIKKKEEIRQNIGYMSQRFMFYEEMTVRENLEFFGSLYNLRGEKLSTAIDRSLHIGEIAQRQNEVVKSLPVGIKQRLALAGAILHNPNMLFLDEPTAGVDPPMRRKFWDYIQTLSNEGKTIFVTTHYMDEAENCDRLALIIGGKIIAMDTPQNLKMNFEYDVYRLRIDKVIEAYEKLRNLNFIREVTIVGNELHIICLRGHPLQIFVKELVKEIQGKKFSLVRTAPTIEDIFVQCATRE